MKIRRALTVSQKEAILTTSGAKVLVEALNAEVSARKNETENLQANYADLQDKYEESQKKFHRVDKKNGILNSKLQYSRLIEIIKYFVTVIGTGYGINTVTNGNNNGWWYVVISGLIFVLIVDMQEKSFNKK